MVMRLALVLAVQAEIEGMKTENLKREQEGMSLAWSESDFFSKSEQLKNLAYCSDEQL